MQLLWNRPESLFLTMVQQMSFYPNSGFSKDKSGQQPGFGEIVRSQTNHKTFNGTRADKLPEITDRSPGTSGVREFPLA
ncbi:hypothetical protein NDI43_05495 [Microcoleus vaginatus GB2-A3]|uniref:hypothetical protein n=1 Tax=Microcoleus vaginatus TaxID=119532 RepID=UPI0032ACCFB5